MDPIKGQEVVQVKFTYEDMKVGRMTEEEYVAEKIQEAAERDGDDGMSFQRAWDNDRVNRFEPKFIELFNRYASRANIAIDYDVSDTDYFLVVNTYFTEPGFNIGISSRHAEVSMTATFFDRNNPDAPVAVFDIAKARGSAAFDRGHRIQEGYAKAGKEFGRTMRRQLR